jgi:hypothetical protein
MHNWVLQRMWCTSFVTYLFSSSRWLKYCSLDVKQQSINLSLYTWYNVIPVSQTEYAFPGEYKKIDIGAAQSYLQFCKQFLSSITAIQPPSVVHPDCCFDTRNRRLTPNFLYLYDIVWTTFENVLTSRNAL